MTSDELDRCATTLRNLAANPALFFDKQAEQFADLVAVRREANRLIFALQEATRAKRGFAPAAEKPSPPAVTPAPTNRHPKNCYACRQSLTRSHARYRWMCEPCGEENLRKREQTADLTGRVAIVTGGRIRIGFQTCLKLLRAGATVHAVTRFPYDAAERYARETDFDAWRQRLVIHGLDLCRLPDVRRFTDEFARGAVEIVINNAAQTLRPTAEFFTRMSEHEHRLAGALPPAIVSRIAEPTRESLLPALAGERGTLAELVGGPNSWTKAFDQIAALETIEVHVINAIAPFLLIQGLLPALRASPRPRRFVVNAAAREGQFAKRGSSRHPHTNMAKAALNMLTRTLAPELSRENIYLNSIDPGWVSDQRPQPATDLPLDDIDGAARYLDLVFQPENDNREPLAGKLWRNFRICPW